MLFLGTAQCGTEEQHQVSEKKFPQLQMGKKYIDM